MSHNVLTAWPRAWLAHYDARYCGALALTSEFCQQRGRRWPSWSDWCFLLVPGDDERCWVNSRSLVLVRVVPGPDRQILVQAEGAWMSAVI